MCFFCSLNNPMSMLNDVQNRPFFPVEAKRGSWRAFLTIIQSITDH